MANYLAVVRHESLVAEGDILRRVLGEASEDMAVAPLPGGWEITWVAQRASHDLLPGQGIFSGFAIDDADSRIMFGAPGLAASGRQPLETDLPGCYVHVHWVAEQLELTADLYRSMSVSGLMHE